MQSPFVGGRNIQDGVLIANEILDEGKRRKRRGLAIKLDFEKAYGNLNRNFLIKMLNSFEFPEKWVRWISECISSVLSSVLVNGSPTKEFKMQRGLRQGDPLSPFPFILAGEGFNILFRIAKEKGFCKGY